LKDITNEITKEKHKEITNGRNTLKQKKPIQK